MNNYEMVKAIQYLLEQRQAELLRECSRIKITSARMTEISEEVNEIEELVERAREGYQE